MFCFSSCFFSQQCVTDWNGPSMFSELHFDM